MFNVSRRLLYIVSLLIAVLLVLYIFPRFEKLRGTLADEYFEHKLFMYNLTKASGREKEYATEESVRSLLKSMGIEPRRIVKTRSGLEVEIKELNWKSMVKMIKMLEERHEIVSFSAVDNTGRGIFEIKVVLR